MSQTDLSMAKGIPTTPYSSGTMPARDGAPPKVSWKQYIADFVKAPSRAKAALVGSLLLVAMGPAGLSALTPFVVPAFAMKTGTPLPEAMLMFVALPLIIGPLVLPFAGQWVDRLGARRVALPGIVLYALVTAIIPLAAGKLWLMGILLVLASIFGFGSSLGIAFKVISEWFLPSGRRFRSYRGRIQPVQRHLFSPVPVARKRQCAGVTTNDAGHGH